jgi:hypothetical protein
MIIEPEGLNNQRVIITTPLRLCASAGKHLTISLLLMGSSLTAGEYFEGFDNPGKPTERDGIHWGYTDELTPVAGWRSIIPGDGLAHLSVTSHSVLKKIKKLRDGGDYLPFQTLDLGPVASNHRISIRAKNAVIPGVACVLFTYREKTRVDEIDIEITADDTQSAGTGHPTGTNGGWSDIRLNTWAGAKGDIGNSGDSLLPKRSIRMPILDAQGSKVSHRDDQFHLYTIEWRPESVCFFIDGVQQAVIKDVVPDETSRVIFGMRRMPWSGMPDWSGEQTMLVDWVDIESLQTSRPR